MREVHDVMLGSDSGSDDEKVTCVVCVDDMVKCEKAAVLACGYFFHRDCAVSWLGLLGTCPVCRRAVVLQKEDGGGGARRGGLRIVVR
jgi:hypothetical protein